MGLDASAYSIKENDRKKIFYWRKHGDLNWCMHVLNLGEDPTTFDGYRALSYVGLMSSVMLGLAELSLIEKAIRSFEYDTSGGYPNSFEKDIVFIAGARQLISLGYKIEYDSC